MIAAMKNVENTIFSCHCEVEWRRGRKERKEREEEGEDTGEVEREKTLN